MEDKIRFLKSLSDPTRLKIISKFLSRKEIPCQEIVKKFSLSQPALSHHLGKLIESEILTYRKDGSFYYYRLNKKNFDKYGINIRKLLSIRS